MIGESEFCPELTPRELEVLELAANGYSAKEVASLIGIAPRTVERHVENVRLKMNARNRVHMITQAIMRGVLKIEVDAAGGRKRTGWLPKSHAGNGEAREGAVYDGLARANRR